MPFIDTQVTGRIIPKASGTRLRDEAHTKAAYELPTYGVNDLVEVDLVREYTEDDINFAVTKGDKWGRVIRVKGVERKGWMAIIYQRVTPPNICTPAYTLVDAPPPPPVGEKPKVAGATVVVKYDDGSISELINMKVIE